MEMEDMNVLISQYPAIAAKAAELGLMDIPSSQEKSAEVLGVAAKRAPARGRKGAAGGADA